jgi:glycosyltransferase involved in cell wall biosynthesis
LANKISGLVITYNEEKNIESCINSLFLVCDEVIVVDSISSDNTVKIAKNCGAKVISQEFLGDGPQRSYGLKYCNNNWVLNLDADERLCDDLIVEIKKLDLNNSKYECYEFKRKNYLHNKWIKQAGWYPNYVRRLFDKNKTDFAPVKTHTKIESLKYNRLNANIIHYSFEDYANMIEIMNKYSSWQADSFFENGKKITAFTAFYHGFASFVKHYILKRGFFAGIDGFNISLLNALGSYFKYMKLYEKNKM